MLNANAVFIDPAAGREAYTVIGPAYHRLWSRDALDGPIDTWWTGDVHGECEVTELEHEIEGFEATVCFAVGEKFSSYDTLKDKISGYESSRSVQRYHSDSRTLEAARKRAPRKIAQANQALVYYSINLSCVFGGKRYHSKSHGKRPHQSTIKQDCEAVIKLSLSDDGQSLVVTEEIWSCGLFAHEQVKQTFRCADMYCTKKIRP
jgi:hypothetical protein